MSRKPPNISAPESVTPRLGAKRTAKSEISSIRQIREYELITPLFGGGTETQKTDPVSAIRVPSIRGQLRFWWRAIRGGQFAGDLKALKKMEDEIFGAASAGEGNPSLIQIALLDCSVGSEDRPFEVVGGKTDSARSRGKIQPRKGSLVHPYAAFTLQPKAEDAVVGMDTLSVKTNVSFKLSVVFPESIAEEIEAAIWSWETFGGIGARTRRGFGSLHLLRLDGQNVPSLKISEAEERIKKRLDDFLLETQFPSDIPHLSKNPLWRITTNHRDAIEAWTYLIERLRQFRQYRKDSEGDLSSFGKSQWTEPDAIRHRAEIASKPSIDKFPRAQFGLPIIFHMYHDHIEATLKGLASGKQKAVERLSSPLILRPLKCADGAVGLALVLDTPRIPPSGLILDMAGSSDEVSSELEPLEARELTKRLELLRNKTDVLEAFLETL
jgi:CRISPR-associated protein Cmr1